MFPTGNRFYTPNQGMLPPPRQQLMTPMDFGAPPLHHPHLNHAINRWRGPPPPPYHHYNPPRIPPLPPLNHHDHYNPARIPPSPPPPSHHYNPPRLTPPSQEQYYDPPHIPSDYAPPLIQRFEQPRPGPGLFPRPPAPSDFHHDRPGPSAFHDDRRHHVNQQRQFNIVKPQPVKPRKLMLTSPYVSTGKKQSPKVNRERMDVYKQVKQILQEAHTPLKVNDPDLMDLFIDLSESLKEAINHEGGYRVFLQKSSEIEVKDGWVKIKQTEVSSECKDEVKNTREPNTSRYMPSPERVMDNQQPQLQPGKANETKQISQNEQAEKTQPLNCNNNSNSAVDVVILEGQAVTQYGDSASSVHFSTEIGGAQDSKTSQSADQNHNRDAQSTVSTTQHCRADTNQPPLMRMNTIQEVLGVNLQDIPDWYSSPDPSTQHSGKDTNPAPVISNNTIQEEQTVNQQNIPDWCSSADPSTQHSGKDTTQAPATSINTIQDVINQQSIPDWCSSPTGTSNDTMEEVQIVSQQSSPEWCYSPPLTSNNTIIQEVQHTVSQQRIPEWCLSPTGTTNDTLEEVQTVSPEWCSSPPQTSNNAIIQEVHTVNPDWCSSPNSTCNSEAIVHSPQVICGTESPVYNHDGAGIYMQDGSPQLVSSPVLTVNPEPVHSPELALMQESVQGQDQVLIPEPVQSPEPVYSPPFVSSYGPVSSPVLACSPNTVASPPLVERYIPVCSPELHVAPIPGHQGGHPGPVCITPPLMQHGPVYSPPLPALVPSPPLAINPVPMFSQPVVFPSVPVCNPKVVFIPRPVVNAGPVCHPGLGYSHAPVGSFGPVYGAVCNPVVGSNPGVVERPSSNGSNSSGSSSISIGITITCPISSVVGQSLTSVQTQNQSQILNPSAPAFMLPQPSGTISVSFGNSEPVSRPTPAKSPLTIVEVSQPESSPVILQAPKSDLGSSLVNAACVAANQEVSPVARLGALPHANSKDEKVSAAVHHSETNRALLSTSSQQRLGESRPEQNKAAVDLFKLSLKSSVYVRDKRQSTNKKQDSVPDKGQQPKDSKQQHSLSSCSRESIYTLPSGGQTTNSHLKQTFKSKSLRVVPMRSLPDVSEDFDDSFMLLKYLPKLTSLPHDKRLYLHAYRLLREAIMKIPTADFTDQTVFIKNALDTLSITERLYIQTLGGSLGFVKKYAEVFHDHKILDVFARKEDNETEVASRSKGTEAEVKKEHKGMVTDEIKMKTSGTNAVTESKDGSVDTQDLEIQVVEQHRFLMKKLALLKDRLAHEKMRNEALKEKSEGELKGLKDKHNKETAKIEEMSKELKMGAGGGLKLQLQISQAQNKHCKEKISESKLVKERLIQELGEKTSKLLFLEQHMKSEVLRKANLVKVNKSTCTQLDGVVQADEDKQDLDVDSREKMILERVQRAEIQILTIEYEKRKEDVKQMLETGEYTYGIFDVGLNISSPERDWLKGQWLNYQDRAQQHLGTLKDMMANQKNVIESSQDLNDIPAITMANFEPFTVLCQVSAGTPSDIHFVVAPPCQSNHSIAAVNSISPTEQNKPSVKTEHSPVLSAIHMPTMTNKRGSSVHTPVLSTIVDEQSPSRDIPDSKNQGSALRTEQMSPARSLVSSMKMLDRSPGNTSRRSRRLPQRKLGTGHSHSSAPKDACKTEGRHSYKESIEVNGKENRNAVVSSKKQIKTMTSSSRSGTQKCHESLISSKNQLSKKTSSSRSGTQKCHVTLGSSKNQLPKTTSSSSRSSSQKCHETLVSSKIQLPKTTSRRSGTQVSNQQEDQLREMIIKESDKLQDPKSGDLEFLLESCWQLASLTIPSASESPSGLNQSQGANDGVRQMVCAPKGLSLPTEVPYCTAIKAETPSSEIKRTATSDSTPYIAETQLHNAEKTDKDSIACIVQKEQESDDTFEGNRKTKANVTHHGSIDKKLPEVDGANFIGSSSSSKASVAKEVGLDLSTAASFDTGIGDCSSGSEPTDLLTYLPDSVKQAGVGDSSKQYIDSCEQDIVADSFEQDIVADEKLYTLSTDEVISVDSSGYKMSERLYRHDSKSDNLESSWWNDFNDEISEQSNKEQSCTSGTHAIQGGVGSGDNVGAAKHRNEELSSLFLPAYAGGDATSSVTGDHNDKQQTRGKQVISDPFLPEWTKDFSEL